jgi:hypothetical protein
MLLITVVAAIGGCGSAPGGQAEKPVTVDWDLSRSHTLADVEWPHKDLTADEIRPTGTVRIRLPEGRAFEADHGIRRIDLMREGDVVNDVAVSSAPLSIDDGYALGVDWAKRFGLPREPLDEWRQKVRSEKPPDLSAAHSFGTDRDALGQGGPVPSVEIVTSFDDKKPVVVSVEFFWPRQRSGARTTSGT